ncbi:hypothetical protein JCM13304A_00690 [Desulfothermus okinawensis JCM 13304]
MVQGGIQGDEISGIITAETLVHSKVKKGNLIVVPRANVPSLLSYLRGINVDLNRRFDKYYNKFYEDHLARAIKLVASFSDGLVHLHEGSGFYSSVYIDELRNPERYGQSFIIDTKNYRNNILLGYTAKTAVSKLNQLIKNKNYLFKIFDMETISPTTRYPEQKKSFSYYTLTKLEKPAFAIEVSKDIKDTKWKTKIQLRACKFVLSELGVNVELSDVRNYFNSRENIIKKIKILLDGEDVTNKKKLKLFPLSKFSLNTLNLNNEFGLAIGISYSNIRELNLLTLNGIPHSKEKSVFLSIDGKKVKKWTINTYNKNRCIYPKNNNIFVCQVNNQLLFVPKGETLYAYEGDRLVLLGLLNGSGDEVINLKGYLTRAGKNSGQDLYSDIILNKDFFISRYISTLKDQKSWTCDVVVEDHGKSNLSFKIVVHPIPKPYLQLKNEKKQLIISLDSSSKIRLPHGLYHVRLIPWCINNRVVVLKDRYPLEEKDIFSIKKGENVSLVVIDTNLAKIKGKITVTGI